jgi:general secretion pathway protein K
MGSASELRLVKGFNEKVYQRIAPYVTALPTTTPTLINVNTAPAVILAVVANIDPNDAVALVQLRQDNPFKTTDEFQRVLSDVAKVTPAQEPAEGQPVFSVKTNYFNLTIETRIGYGRAALTSLIARADAANIQVLQRAQGLS